MAEVGSFTEKNIRELQENILRIQEDTLKKYSEFALLDEAHTQEIAGRVQKIMKKYERRSIPL